MAVLKSQVFLVQGQQLKNVDGHQSLLPEIVQRVVVAPDYLVAYDLLEQSDLSFKSVGHATLEDYEATALKLRATLKGESSDWPLLVAVGMQ